MLRFLVLAFASAWDGTTVKDLHQQYYNIFTSGNRNAASHLWSSFLLDHAESMPRERFELLSSGYCPVSGSPVTPSDSKRFLFRLPHVDGSGPVNGFLHLCCWPCICDTIDFVGVDTKTVQTADGEERYNFAVLGNPCTDPAKLKEPFDDVYGRSNTLEMSAPEVRCDGSRLVGAPLSDHGYVIIGMFLAAPAASPEVRGNPKPGRMTSHDGVKYQDSGEYQDKCIARAHQGYNSGMGEIFRRVAMISPVVPGERSQFNNASSVFPIEPETATESSAGQMALLSLALVRAWCA